MVSPYDKAQALRMIDIFSSVGAQTFDITHLDIDGEKRGFRPKPPRAQARRSIPILVENAARRQNNVIVRPYSDRVEFVQLDDLNGAGITRVRPAAFLILATSPGNHQAWVAVSDLRESDRKDFARRLRRGCGADLNASGATRVAGSANFKRKYEQHFPIVEIAEAEPGRTVTRAELGVTLVIWEFWALRTFW